MGLLFNNYLEEGYYEKDSYDTFTKLNSANEIYNALFFGNLYQNDGLSTTHITKEHEMSLPIPPKNI